MVAANALSRAIRNETISSFRSKQYTPGEVPFIQADFAKRALAAGIDPNVKATMTEAVQTLIPPEMQSRIKPGVPDVSIHKALDASSHGLAAKLGIEPREARYLQLRALGAREPQTTLPHLP